MTRVLALMLMLAGCKSPSQKALAQALREQKPVATEVWIQKLTEAQKQEAALVEALRTGTPIK